VSSVAGFFINQHLEKYYSRFTAKGHIQYTPVLNYDPIHNPTPHIDSGELALEPLHFPAQNVQPSVQYGRHSRVDLIFVREILGLGIGLWNAQHVRGNASGVAVVYRGCQPSNSRIRLKSA